MNGWCVCVSMTNSTKISTWISFQFFFSFILHNQQQYQKVDREIEDTAKQHVYLSFIASRLQFYHLPQSD